MDLEPAERNPAELRRTAYILVAIMMIGAFFVLYAYVQHERSTDPNRPPITAKITRNLAAKNQRNEFCSLSFLEGKVWIAAPFCVSQLDESKHAIAMMKEVAAHYEGNEELHFVLISIEGVDMGVSPQQLAEAEKELGIDGARWTLLTSNDTKKQRGYIKDQLRLGLVTERQADEISGSSGKWKFPSEIALVDREFHVRQRYDFTEAYTAQIRAQREIEKHPEIKQGQNLDFHLKAVSRLKKTLFDNIDYVLNETETGK